MSKTMLTTLELAERWAMSAATLENWRVQKKGPKYVKLGGKKVVYRISNIIEYEKNNEVK